MLRFTALFTALAAVVTLSNSEVTQAGLLGCGCSHGPVHHAPAMYAGPGMYIGGDVDACSECAIVMPSCCGIGGVGGGFVQLGSLYGSGGHYGGHYGGWYGGSPDPRSFESGFENLPNMDGGGVHHRLPFHSYRRPWAHPGVADNNINIVW